MNITQSDVVTSAYLFLVLGGVIVFTGAIVVYLSRRPKRRR